MLTPPRLSVVLVSPNGFQTTARTIAALRSQAVHRDMELVLVTDSDDNLAADSRVDGFLRTLVVRVNAISHRGAAAAKGVHAATAPVVVLIENHGYPGPGWAEALLERHTEPWAAVGPLVVNQNPATACSWANYVVNYGTLAPPQPSGMTEILPWHNTSYKRELLLPYGERLGDLLEREGMLHADLVARGLKLFREARAVIHHENISRPQSMIKVQYYVGRIIGATRAEIEGRGLVRQIGCVLASPLVPLTQARWVLPAVLRMDRPRGTLIRILPMLAVSVLAQSAGKVVGYVAGLGSSLDLIQPFELWRFNHLAAVDQRNQAGQSTIGSAFAAVPTARPATPPT